jgi:hypothetical protein
VTLEERIAALLQEYARRKQAEKMTRWCPQIPTPKQAAFVALGCLEALFGGSAGPGKSSGLLMAGLQYVDVPNYAALILRKTYKDLAKPGAIMDRAGEWLRNTSARWNNEQHTWTFPSGARLAFGHLETEADKYEYQSAEFQFIGWDELTQFPESQYTYLLSRLRRLSGSTIPLRSRGATNPGGLGHGWVKARFVDEKTRKGVFIQARLSDNPHVDQAEYLKALDQLDEMTKRQLRDGEWVQDTGGLIYRYSAERNGIGELPLLPDGSTWSYIWGVDFGSSEKTPSTAIGVTAFTTALPNAYIVESSKHAGMTVSDVADRYRADVLRFKGFQCVLGDQGGLGGGYLSELQQRHNIPIVGVEKQNKLGFRKLFNDDLGNGKILVVERSCSGLIDEWNELSWNDKGTDCRQGQADHCFVAGTMIETDRGEVPIEAIRVGDLVLTQQGFFPVKISGHTGDREVITRTFSNGRNLTGTPEHRILLSGVATNTLIGLTEYDTLCAKENCAWLKRSNTGGGFGEDTQNRNGGRIASIFMRARNAAAYLFASIVESGRIITGRSQMVATSTTSMETRRTTTQATSLAFPLERILPSTGNNFHTNLANRLGSAPPSGTARPPAELGTPSKIAKTGAIKSRFQKHALCAAKRLNQKDQQRSAQTTVSLNSVATVASTTRPASANGATKTSPATNTASRLFAVGPAIRGTQTQTVYNLGVDGPHEYFANGILVANCSDQALYNWREARHWLFKEPEPAKTPEQKINETWQRMRKEAEARKRGQPISIRGVRV